MTPTFDPANRNARPATRRPAIFGAAVLAAGAAVAVGAGGASAATDEPLDCSITAESGVTSDGDAMVAEFLDGEIPDDAVIIELDESELDGAEFVEFDLGDLDGVDLDHAEWGVAEMLPDGEIPDDVVIIELDESGLDGVALTDCGLAG